MKAKYEGEEHLPKVAEYIGETGSDLHTRSKQHHKLWLNNQKSSWALRHYVKHHQDVPKEDAKFTYEVLKFHRSAFDRQVHEALQIKWSKADPGTNNCNNKCEYNRCLLPDFDRKQYSDADLQDEEDTDRLVEEWKAGRPPPPPPPP